MELKRKVDRIIARLEEKLGPFSPGRGRGVNVMRLNLDATYPRMKIHPFFLVFTLDAVLSRCGSALALYQLGMARGEVGALTIWKAGPNRRQCRDDGGTPGRPLIFCMELASAPAYTGTFSRPCFTAATRRRSRGRCG